MASAEILYTDAVVQVAAHRNLLIVAWSDAPAVMHLRECARLGRLLARQFEGGVALLDLILSGTPNFTSEVRKEAVRLHGDLTLYRLGIADVILVPGLVGVAVRAFLGTNALLAKGGVPNRIFANLAEAEEWLLPRVNRDGQSWDVGEIVSLARPIVATRKKA